MEAFQRIEATDALNNLTEAQWRGLGSCRAFVKSDRICPAHCIHHKVIEALYRRGLIARAVDQQIPGYVGFCQTPFGAAVWRIGVKSRYLGRDG